MKQTHQNTLASSTVVSGIGVHSGDSVKMALHPADADHGIVFLRTNLPNGVDRLIDARHMNVAATELCTVVGDRNTGAVATIEHLMAALSGLGVDNVLVEIDGPELPIVDGSAAPFVDAIDAVGLVATEAPRRALRIRRPVRVDSGKAFAELTPHDAPLRLDVEIDFTDSAIGRQRWVHESHPRAFRRDIARARTFGFMRDVEHLWKVGFALGASLDNTVAVSEDGVVNPEGLRFPDEFVRHKLLDAIGDLALAGYPILGSYRSYCGGHRLNFAVLEALFSDRANYELVELAPRREHAASNVGAPAFGNSLR
ncbi:UDP-3-O-acyl-N-acetylglucosamine deacetylase [Saliniramus sp.]|uniref:UDP-3-O-acyl-N-acetylglucosamine deacetylase n=1 Tax=Saliniramus sp. TaxID=2986772 RepID=UPI002CD7CD8B|nr:UDP-3-O-acyl-N-acetylglucosamine deacetylase [Saliniramus sp.]HMB11063.1 UDP-3-O-acyl-N-acetylglucosamine deacetylase [Saliniramus sp.]